VIDRYPRITTIPAIIATMPIIMLFAVPDPFAKLLPPYIAVHSEPHSYILSYTVNDFADLQNNDYDSRILQICCRYVTGILNVGNILSLIVTFYMRTLKERRIKSSVYVNCHVFYTDVCVDIEADPNKG
jgi:hypothetical protein